MEKLICVLIFLLFFSTIVSATFISLTVTIPEIIIENKTQSSLKIINSGDEAAFSLNIALILPKEFESDKIWVNTLNPNSSFEGLFNITKTKNLTPGRYPAVVFVDYTDANSYPFSAVFPASIIYKVNTISKVYGAIDELKLIGKKSKNLNLNLRNLDDTTHEVKVRLFLPRELKVEEEEKTLLIKGKEEKQLEFKVANFAALEGSSYVVLASIEYESEGLHYSSFATGIVKIDSEGIFDKKTTINPIHILIILYLIIIIVVVFYKIKPKISKV